MQTIIVSTDFSESANHILEYATNLSIHLNTSLTIFHAYQVPIAYSDMPVVTLSLEEIKKHSDEKLQFIKKDIEEKTEKALKVEIKLKIGEPANELKQVCNEINPLMVILGTGNSNSVERAFLGSTAMNAVNHLKQPILIIPHQAKFKYISKIGFACDFMKVESTTPIQLIKYILKSLNAKLHVIHVNAGIDEKVMKIQRGKLSNLLDGIDYTIHVIKNEDVEKGLHQFSLEEKIDMLITIPKKHDLIDRIFKKRHVKEIIFHSEIPILSIHE